MNFGTVFCPGGVFHYGQHCCGTSQHVPCVPEDTCAFSGSDGVVCLRETANMNKKMTELCPSCWKSSKELHLLVFPPSLFRHKKKITSACATSAKWELNALLLIPLPLLIGRAMGSRTLGRTTSQLVLSSPEEVVLPSPAARYQCQL